MATIKLGSTEEGATTLSATVAESLPVTFELPREKYVMSDGSKRWRFSPSDFRAWTLNFTAMTEAELNALIALVETHSVLGFQNAWQETTWYNVVVTGFTYDTPDPAAATEHYSAQLILEGT